MRESAASTSSRALPLLLLPTMQPLHLHHCRRIRIHHFSLDPRRVQRTQQSVYASISIPASRIPIVGFLHFRSCCRPKKKIPNQRSAKLPTPYHGRIVYLSCFRGQMIVHVRTIEMMVLKSVRLRSRPSGLKLSCINFSILKRSDMACVSTPRARVTDACKCVSANLRLPPAAAGTRSDGCDAQANRQ